MIKHTSFALLLLFLLTQCHDVTLDDAQKDTTAPSIDIGTTDPTGKFSGIYKNNADITIDRGTQLYFIASAFNSGGVKNLVLAVSNPAITQVRSGAPDAQNKVPQSLKILADEAGIPIKVTFSNPGETVKVEAVSENHNFKQSTLTLNYTVPDPPVIEYLKFPKRINGLEDGYVNLGNSTDILWNVTHCSAGCTVSLVAKIDPGWTTTVFTLNNLPASGSHTVTPTRITHYTLTATNKWGSVTKEVDQDVHIEH